jgi:hypothetical protein
MDLIDEIKTIETNIIWEENKKEYISGKSKPIMRYPFKFEEELLVMESINGYSQLKFSCDDENKYLVPVSNKDDFLRLYDIYTARLFAEDDQIDQRDNAIIALPHENTMYFYGGLCQNMDKIDCKLIFNKYLCKTKKRYKSANWLSEQPREISSYFTMFSNTLISFKLLTKFSIQVESKDETTFVHPLFIKVNYPSANNVGATEAMIDKTDLAAILTKDVPHDAWAALETETVYNKQKVQEMIDLMNENNDKSYESEKDYLTFVMATLDELNRNYYLRQ